MHSKEIPGIFYMVQTSGSAQIHSFQASDPCRRSCDAPPRYPGSVLDERSSWCRPAHQWAGTSHPDTFSPAPTCNGKALQTSWGLVVKKGAVQFDEFASRQGNVITRGIFMRPEDSNASTSNIERTSTNLLLARRSQVKYMECRSMANSFDGVPVCSNQGLEHKFKEV